MAYYAALVSVLELLKEINNPKHPYSNFLVEKHQIHESLYEKFKLLQVSLEDYSPKFDKDAADNCLERRIRYAADEAQGIIESHISDRIPQLLLAEGFEELSLENIGEKEYYAKLERVKEEVDSIVEKLRRVELESHKTHEDNLQVTGYSTKSVEASNVQVPSGRNTIVGFDKHLTAIKDQLCGHSFRRGVISVVGMGGLGKTTLARQIFDDKLIDDYFDYRVWVTVSQDYNMLSILLTIANSLSINVEDELAENIYKHLKGRKYLIIMDDVWDCKVWDEVRRIFPDDSNGSRIMITTRQSDVALYASTSGFIHQIPFLNESQSWNLFCEKVFCPSELEDIGRLIAKNCRGLPLAIVVVAGLVSKANTTRYEWEKIERGVSYTATYNDEHFSKILSLSYNHLPHHLKPCFLYLGGFPEDYEIPISKLIKLWVAEGFLEPIESKTLEKVAEEYLDDLVTRNLVFLTKKRSNGKFKYCGIHDLLRDLCSHRAHYENFLRVLRKKEDFHREVIGSVHNLYIYPECFFRTNPAKEHASHLRSILFFPYLSNRFLSYASGFKLLRVLDAGNAILFVFPHEIVELLHLRYLALHFSELRIPPSISKLQNLQTLIVYGRNTSLPSVIWKMSRLRHVIIQSMDLPPIPFDEMIIGGVFSLGRLQTLSTVVDFAFTRDTVEMISSVKNLKVVCTCEPYKNWEKFCLNNLVYLHELEILDIRFSRYCMLDSPLPESFAFSGNLKELSLYGCMIPWRYMTTLGSLPSLQVLKLRSNACVGEEWEPTEGEFPMLKYLLMDKLSDLKYWRAENTHFPRLEHLHIRDCGKLEEIPSGIGDIPTLQLVSVSNSKFAADSALKIQEEQQDMGNDTLQFRIFYW